ncbi:hypothetical protein HOE39_02455 [Candidatus Woesearchaeota archaeon]|jgi:hypothetical protein|nr:hypothetical protein [Candidatus Woesearchaeota archaeon]
MDYFNKRGGVNFQVVAIVMAIVSFGVAIMIYAGVGEVVMENADFNCIVGNRLANLAGSTSNPCRTTLATIEQIDFKEDLTVNHLECPQISSTGWDIKTVAKNCGAVKLADKGVICWINYLSGEGTLQTSTCYNLCMKPSYGSIEVKDSEGVIPLEFTGLTAENLKIFEDDGFNSKNPQHLRNLKDTSERLELSLTTEGIEYKKLRSGDLTIVVEIPFQDIYVSDIAYVFEEEQTSTGGNRGERYTDKISKDNLRMNTVSYYDQGPFDFDTNTFRPSTDNDELFTFNQDESWIIQYQDSEDWARVPFLGEASDISGYWDTDISEDSLNYGYNGVC